jgi:hypothetical protein
MKIKGNSLEINFNSNDLAELIKSHEGDEFEIEREDSIDGVILDPIDFKYIELKGRSITGSAEQKLFLGTYETDSFGSKFQRNIIGDSGFIAFQTDIVSKGTSRNSEMNLEGEFLEANPTEGAATEAMFLIDSEVDVGLISIDLSFNFNFKISSDSPYTTGDVYLDLVKYKYNGTMKLRLKIYLLILMC